MRKFVVFLAFVCVAYSAVAQKVRFNISFVDDTANIEKVYVQPLNLDFDSKTVAMRQKKGVYTGAVAESGVGFYNIVLLKDRSQLILPVYISNEDDVSLVLRINNKILSLDNTPENRAISRLNRAINSLDRELWLNSDMTGEQMKALVSGYKMALDSILLVQDVSENVAQYMAAYAYTHAFNAYSSIPRTQEIPATSIPFSRSDVLPDPDEAFDNEYTPLFFSALQFIKSEYISYPSLIDKLHALYDEYSNNSLRLKVASLMMGEFLSKYNYAADFEGGLEVVKIATERFSLPDTYIAEYMKRISTVPGSPFPEDVELLDADGKVVDFSSFKGKYVYIDIWASWCGPCCKEAPNLLKLEKELENENVVFVSVSCDTSEAAWKAKMAELGLHGHQLIDKNNSLGDALNVSAVPFFVIYDKEGKLHTYRAMRPSRGELLKNFLENLK